MSGWKRLYHEFLTDSANDPVGPWDRKLRAFLEDADDFTGSWKSRVYTLITSSDASERGPWLRKIAENLMTDEEITASTGPWIKRLYQWAEDGGTTLPE